MGDKPRLVCVVPSCTSSTSRWDTEWICSRHWQLVPREHKKRYAAACTYQNKVVKAYDEQRAIKLPHATERVVPTLDARNAAVRLAHFRWHECVQTVNGQGEYAVEIEAFMNEIGLRDE